MNEDSTSSPTSLDQKVDSRIETPHVGEETYKNNVAGLRKPLTDTASDAGRFSAIAEIERTISSDVLPTRQRKLSQFGVSLSRRSDFRLKDLTSRIGRQIKQDFEDEINSGPVEKRIRGFDVQSQTMRMITANSALSSYQFQKQNTLPFMRKSLALDYAKVDILKRISQGISTLEKSVVSKLEAIKMNTAGAVPKELGLFGTIRKEVRDQNIKRVAGNISNLIMDRYDEKYKKHVSPLLTRLHRIMEDTSSRGGVNGVSRAASVRLNALRKITKQVGNPDVEPTTAFGRVKSAGARLANSVLGGAVRTTQRFKLGEGTNSFLSKGLQSQTSFLSQLQPFGANDRDPHRSDDNPAFSSADVSAGRHLDHSPLTRILNMLSDWRVEVRKHQATVVEHLAGIRKSFSSDGTPSKLLGTSKSQRRDRPAKILTANPKVVTPPVVTSPRTVMGRITMPKVVTGLWSRDKTKLAERKDPTEKKDFVKKLMGSMTDRLSSINTSIREDNKSRGLFEKMQIKRQQLLDKVAEKAKIRKNSYEDLLARRAARKEANKAAMGPWGPRSGLAGAAAAAALGGKEGGVVDELKSGIIDKAKEHAQTMAAAAAGASWKSLKRGAKFVGKNGIKGSLRAGKLGAKGLLTGGKFGTKLAARGGLGAAKLGGKGLLGALKMGGKGLLTLGKGGLGLGVAAAVGQHYFDKSGVKGNTKRVGDTAFEMAQYGALGATAGSLFGGVGAIPGAAIGAAVGAVVANADYAAGQFGAIGDKVSTAFFGKRGYVNPDGTVARQEKTSLFEDVKIAFFGRKAKYLSNGAIIAPERTNLIGSVQYGFQKFFFGDKYNNGEYKEGTSVMQQIGASLNKAATDFGTAIKNLPKDVTKGFGQLVDKTKKLAQDAKDGTVKGARSAGEYLNRKATSVKTGAALLAVQAIEAKRTFSVQNLLNTAKTTPDLGKNVGYAMLPALFGIGTSTAILGWASGTGRIDDPTSPYYAFVTEVLNAYGVKTRSMYNFVHSLEMSQDKVNSGKINAFDDNDMVSMAVRFGFDPKNKDALNFFKLWYKRRFMPAMLMIGTILRRHQLGFGSAMSADEKTMAMIAAEIKEEVAKSDFTKNGLEPSGQAYNKYAKIGNADPGKAASANLSTSKPFDPRDARNAANDNSTGNSQQNQTNSWSSKLAAMFGWNTSSSSAASGQSSSSGYSDDASTPAARRKANRVKGGIKDQPEYKTAYGKLPADARKMVDKSKSLQFVLWSTSVQHGAQMAAEIFQREYSDKLDEKAYIRSIYQDRSTRFGALRGSDRTEALAHLGQETDFALGIQSGTNKATMDDMGRQVSDVINPNGNYGGTTLLKGSVKGRAREAVNYLMSKKYTRTAAIGIAANLIGESNLQPGDNRGDGGISHGIAQWQPPRRKAIHAHFGKPIESMDLRGQLDALDWEIRTGKGLKGGKPLFNELNSTNNVHSVVSNMVSRFEMPADIPGDIRKRSAIANGLMAQGGLEGGGESGGDDSSFVPAGARGGQKPVASQTPASKGKALRQKPHVPTAHERALQANTTAMHRFSSVIEKGARISDVNPQGAGTTNVMLNNSPMINRGGGAAREHFVTMSMRKARQATGE
jgi:hypothetical protein